MDRESSWRLFAVMGLGSSFYGPRESQWARKRTGLPTIMKIREEDLKRSQVMDIAQ